MVKKHILPNLESLSIEELLTLKEQIEKQIKKNQKAEKKILLKKMNAIAKNAGYSSAAEIMIGTRSERKDKGLKSPPMYKHPTEDKTWTGKGRVPGWMLEYEKKKGNTREDLLIKEQTNK
ncbi:MAG: H-NS histone family protein [Magnetococcales bacterium]|nr:H-NS histone family protein [Magnetococcales bacterium]